MVCGHWDVKTSGQNSNVVYIYGNISKRQTKGFRNTVYVFFVDNGLPKLIARVTSETYSYEDRPM